MNYLISLCIGYIIGSFPTAYVFLKKSRELDIRNEGSGNVGAMNSYETTGSKKIGVIVLLLDLFKGLLTVWLIGLIFPNNFTLIGLALVFAVISHCYNPWIGFKGGRGLATAAGGLFLLFPYLLVIWIIIWLIVYVLRKDIHTANIAAIVLSLFLVYNTSDIAIKYVYPSPGNVSELILFTTFGLSIILIKHLDPLMEIIEKIKEAGIKK